MSYRYLGNKTRLADWIVGLVAERLPAGATIADPMCGTASMSAAFARAGYRVTASDALLFPVLHARARLLTDTPARFAAAGTSYGDAVAHLNALPPAPGFFAREYAEEGRPANGVRPRRYFTAANAARIDTMRGAIREWRAEGLDDLAADLLLHDLILAANRVASIAGTYGYYRATFDAPALAPIALVPNVAEDVGGGHRVLHGDAADTIAAVEADAVYLDPPYTKRQYGGNYHILETLAREDEPEPAGEGGLRDWKPQASAFCYRRRAAGAFRDILDHCRSRWIFVSYSDDGHLTKMDLIDLLRGYGTVERHENMVVRYSSNAASRSGGVHEHLYILDRADAR